MYSNPVKPSRETRNPYLRISMPTMMPPGNRFMRHGKSFDDGEVLRMFGVPPSDGPESTETTITKTITFSESAAPRSLATP